MQWFLNLKISRKLVFSSALLLAMMAALGLFAIAQLRSLNASTEDVVLNWMPSAIVSSALNTDTSDFRILALQHVATLDGAAMETIDRKITALAATIERDRSAYARLIASPEEKKLFDSFGASWNAYLLENKKLLELSRNNQNNEATALLNGDSQKMFDAASAELFKLVELNKAGGKQAGERSAQVYASARAWIVASMAIALVLGMVMALWLARMVSAPLERALRVARTVAAGDLSSNIEVRSTDEAGLLMAALKEMNANLLRIVGDVRTGTDTIATASKQISAGNLDLSSRTEQQASSLEETASSMEELTSTVKQNADNARQATLLAETASSVAVKGGTVVSQVVATMGTINASSNKIVDIISVIDGIAFQTNILALNAAVEAARAGEQGRGFAVVASEVRNLAQRSAGAAREIKELIGNSVEQVDIGARLVEQAGSTMTEIVDSVRRVSDIMNEISTASHEQTVGIEQINEAITQMDTVTQQNAALVEEAAAAAAALQEQAQVLQEAVSVFELGSHAMVMAARPAAAAQVRARPAPAPARKALAVAASTPAAAMPRAATSTAPGNADWEEF